MKEALQIFWLVFGLILAGIASGVRAPFVMGSRLKKCAKVAFFLGVFLYPGHEILLSVFSGAAAQTGGLGGIITSPPALGSSVLSFFNLNAGPQASVVQVSGGTFTANGTNAVTVTNANITANSVVIFGMKTANSPGTGGPFMFAVTPGASFQIKSTGTDASVYNYWILG